MTDTNKIQSNVSSRRVRNEINPESTLVPFWEQANQLLKEGYRNHSSKDYVTDQIVSLAQTEPALFAEHPALTDFQYIKQSMVLPYFDQAKQGDGYHEAFTVPNGDEASHDFNYDDYFQNSSVSKLPATGDTEIVFYEGRRDNKAFGAHTYVVDPNGMVVAGPFKGNTLPNDAAQFGTTAEGTYEFREGLHKEKYPAFHVGKWNQSHTEFVREVPTVGMNPAYPGNGNQSPEIATLVNIHKGKENGNEPADRFSEACLTLDGADWEHFMQEYEKANEGSPNPGTGYVSVVR